MRECCGNCEFNRRRFDVPEYEHYAEFCCGNEDSENYGVPTDYSDTCDEFIEKD